ncbi:MAG: hypothetical protein PVF45_01425 [Anaerolineae bacterium]|jgi:hypothetical protein
MNKKTIMLVVVIALALVGVSLTVTSAAAGSEKSRAAAPSAPAAVVSDTISYQGRLLDSSGNPINGTRVMTFSLYADLNSVTSLWSQSTSVSLDDGLFNVNLTVNPGLFDGRALWLGVQLAGETEMTPRQPLLPAPYALSLRPGAAISGTVGGAPTLDVISVSSIGVHASTHSADPNDGAIVGENEGGGPGGIFFSQDDTGLVGDSVNGIGVRANTHSTDPNDGAFVGENEGSGHGGVFFSEQGHGVYGQSNSTVNAAGFFTSSDSVGVRAVTRSTDPNDGAFVGENEGSGHGGAFFSTQGYGVYGQSDSSINAAGYFSSADSIGVRAITHSTDPNDGAVVGENEGDGHGGVFYSTLGHGGVFYSTFGYGVYGQSESVGCAAGFFTSSNSAGVYAITNSTDPNTGAVGGKNEGGGPGGIFISQNDTGLVGDSVNGIGVRANTHSTDPNDGAFVGENEGSGHGGVFFSELGHGVYGQSNSTVNAAGFFTSSDSVGVRAVTHSTDPNDGAFVGENEGSGHGGVFFSALGHGVYGQSDSTVNAAGFFTSSDSVGVRAVTRSTDPNDGAFVGENEGDGHGGVFFSELGHGVYGQNDSAVNAAGFFASSNSVGVRAITNSTDPNDAAFVGENMGDGPGAFFFSSNDVGLMSNSANGPAGVFSSTHSHGVSVDSAGLDGLRIQDAVGRDYIRAGSDGDPHFRVQNDGMVLTDRGYRCGDGAMGCLQTGSADVAERVNASEVLEPGDVVEIDPTRSDHFRLARTPYSALVAGVISSDPAIVMGTQGINVAARGVEDERPPLALVGRVPVKVSAENGPIHPGDLLVISSTPGHAMRADDPPPGTILGKALEPLDTGRGLILVLVMLQ